MDLVDRLLDYLATVPPYESVDEVRDQLSAYTHRDLRAACTRLGLQVPRKLNKKSGFLVTLVNHWKGEALTTADDFSAKTPPKSSSESLKPTSTHKMPDEVLDLARFVEQFPMDGTADELRDQLNGCRSRTLRSACVLLELQPHRTATKSNFVALLVNYWEDAGAVAPTSKTKEPTVTPMAVRATEPRATPASNQKKKKKVTKDEEKEEEVVKNKRIRAEEELEEKEKPPKKKKTAEVQIQHSSVERAEDEEASRSVMLSSLEKAKVVKEWASAIEILSRVDGSAESISSIRSLIDGVVESAVDEL